ncbi:XRE family transcriptional regulator [Kitasatospora sp. NPDC052868]|uniref:MmyB family transcriptional regulator n=1 Tax=Kitasatospora sp. NPDC052868 TaxID=3364060 RepID=UPI0037CCA523
MKSFGRLLREERGRQDPERHGLPARPHSRGRRVAGLSQEQMDELLGWPAGTYGRFERGEKRNARLLRAVVKTLGSAEEQYEGLHLHLFGFRPPRRLAGPGDRIGSNWERVVRLHPEPAYTTNLWWEVEFGNSMFAGIFPDGRAPENTMRWMMCSEDARYRLVNWERDWAPLVAAQLRGAAAEFPDHPELCSLVRDIRADPVAGRIYDGTVRAYQQPDGDVRMLRHAGCGDAVHWVVITAGQPLGAPGARFMVLQMDPLDGQGGMAVSGDFGSS